MSCPWYQCIPRLQSNESLENAVKNVLPIFTIYVQLVCCITLTESVGEPVTIKVEKIVGQDFEVRGVWLQCHVERGTFPQYFWFRNNKRLDSKGSFYIIYHTDHSSLGVVLDPRGGSDGDYHCEAVNSFDNTTSVSSPSILISHEGNRIFTICCAINTLIKVHWGSHH